MIIALGMWFGASDTSTEGYWTWDNGGRPMYPGYANWLPNEPSNTGDEDCASYRINLGSFGWNDSGCSSQPYGGICESQP